ncbi:MAG: 3-hydroxylacyl-ACP dehydratase [Myxococcales bacterium]|nr:MAG: 3-hydroxylacyl-ACP dehydratase [Myxococcales bacterium]
MSGAGFAAIAALLPQAGPMCLLDRVLEHAADHTVCAVDPRRSRLLAAPDGSVPAWVGLEYMAQCIAAHGGLAALARGEAPRPGVFLGSRRVGFGVQHFAIDRELRVSARHHRGERGLVAFDCEIRELDGGFALVHGRLNVYLVETWQALEGAGGNGL